MTVFFILLFLLVVQVPLTPDFLSHYNTEDTVFVAMHLLLYLLEGLPEKIPHPKSYFYQAVTISRVSLEMALLFYITMPHNYD